MLPIGLVLVGSAPAPVAGEHGDYVDWFRRLADRCGAEIVHFDGLAGEPIDLDAVSSLVVSGSPSSLTAPEPWMDQAIELVRRAKTRGTPLLGICFGHQLIGVAAGARVIENPRGWEFATVRVRQTVAGTSDPLFSDVPVELDANQAHRDIIDPASIPTTLEVLAENDKSRVQAIAWGDAVRGLQFHPEFSGPVQQTYLGYYYDTLAADADTRGQPADHPRALRARDCPNAERIFENFVRHFAAKA